MLRPLADRYVTAGGVKTCYWQSGEKGTPLILIHGLAGSADIWLNNIDSLARHHRVYALDLPGFGRSDRPDPSFSPYDYCRILDDFIIRLDIDRATLIGQSLGGGIALQYALQFPLKVRSLVLVDSAGLGKEVIWTLRLMSLPLFGELMSYPTRKGVELFFKFAVRDQSLITEDFVDRYYSFFSAPGFQNFLLRLLRAVINVYGVRQEILTPIFDNLHEIAQPVLIIWGGKDRVFPLAHAHTGRTRMRRASLEIFQACGHLPFFEEADRFNRLVLRFLQTS